MFGQCRNPEEQLFLRHERVGAEFFAEFHEGHLRAEPEGVFGDTVHGLDSVVANQESLLSQRHEGFEGGADAIAGKFKVAGIKTAREEARAERAGISEEIPLEIVFSRAHIGQQRRLAFFEGNDGPFVENNLFVAGIHPLCAYFNQLICLLDVHNKSQVRLRKQIADQLELSADGSVG